MLPEVPSPASSALLASEDDQGDEHSGSTPFHDAVSEGNIDLVRQFLNQGVSANMLDWLDRSPLREAAEQGHVQVTSLLIERGADVNFRDEEGYTALHIAAENGYLEIVSLLLDAGADLAVCGGSDSGTALHKAAREQDATMVQLLLDRGADPDAEDMDGETASYLQHFFSTHRPPERTAQILDLLRKAGATR